MSDISINWKKITRGLSRGKRYASDRIPTLEEIRKIVEYPDRRIKPIVYTMCSSGIRLGAWDYLKWKHIIPIKRAKLDNLLLSHRDQQGRRTIKSLESSCFCYYYPCNAI